MTKRTVKQNANELHDAEVSWISLVDRPANRIPFRIMKAETPENMRSNAMINMGLSGLFNSTKQEKAAPSIAAIVLRKEDQERMLPLLKEAGFSVEDVDTEQEGVAIVKQEDFDPETAVTIKLKNETAVILSNVEKAFTPFPDTLDFDEKLKAAGFFPSVHMATEALLDTVSGIMFDARSPDEAKSKMDNAISAYSSFVSSLTSSLPVAAFKVEALEIPASTEGAESADETTAAKEDAAEETTAKEDAAGEEAKKDEGAASEAAAKEDADKEGVAEDDATGKEAVKEDETGSEDGKLNELITLVASLKSEMSDGLKAVKTDIEKVKTETEGYASRIEQVEATAKSAETAVKGTVVVGGETTEAAEEGFEYDSAMARKSDTPDDVWAGSPVSIMLG